MGIDSITGNQARLIMTTTIFVVILLIIYNVINIFTICSACYIIYIKLQTEAVGVFTVFAVSAFVYISLANDILWLVTARYTQVRRWLDVHETRIMAPTRDSVTGVNYQMSRPMKIFIFYPAFGFVFPCFIYSEASKIC